MPGFSQILFIDDKALVFEIIALHCAEKKLKVFKSYQKSEQRDDAALSRHDVGMRDGLIGNQILAYHRFRLLLWRHEGGKREREACRRWSKVESGGFEASTMFLLLLL